MSLGYGPKHSERTYQVTHRHRGQEEEAKNLIELLDQLIRNTTRINLGIYSNQMKKELKKVQVSCQCLDITTPDNGCNRGPTTKNKKVGFNENQLQGVVLTRGDLAVLMPTLDGQASVTCPTSKLAGPMGGLASPTWQAHSLKS
ncbi:hypothetical protein BY996DRAFT_6419140 [Phakopsora pachyrhizi]|nr:hypothetical protein BY996DRAFT_6419140 [Phakopsora pachyrhizi]